MIRHEYETIYVTSPDLEAGEQTRIDERLHKTIATGDGEVLSFDKWGRRKLAYTIRRHQQGNYQYLHFVAPAELVLEVERVMNLEDSLIRYLTVKLDEDVELDAVRAGAAEAQELRASMGLVAEEEPVEGDSDDDTDSESDDDDDDDSSDTDSSSEED